MCQALALTSAVLVAGRSVPVTIKDGGILISAYHICVRTVIVCRQVLPCYREGKVHDKSLVSVFIRYRGLEREGNEIGDYEQELVGRRGRRLPRGWLVGCTLD